MKLIGEDILAKDGAGRPVSRIATMFFRTPGLVTARGIHAMQRVMWLDALNAERTEAGQPPLTPEEEEAEIAQSVDLIVTENHVLIRPDPERMDLAVKADEALAGMMPKRRIRYLNTSSAKVRAVLCARGENWRMARHPISQEDMQRLVEGSVVSIRELPLYFYNRATGTRFITASGYEAVRKLDDAGYRRQVSEIAEGLKRRNRLGQPEIDVFPVTTPIEIKKEFLAVEIEKLSDAELRRCFDKIATDWRMTLPAELRDETVANYAWRNEMCHTITREPNETSAEEQLLVTGIAPEFYRQIEWLPGARIDRGEVIFDATWDEAARSDDPHLKQLCDPRVKSLIFNLTRLFGEVEFINVGRIVNSLARRPVEGNRRGNVYIIQYREAGNPAVRMNLIRFQKWGVAERLDEGKDMLQAILESDEYTDYILDRRLMCRQLGMNLPARIGFAHMTEPYRGKNAKYDGYLVRSAYFVRPYVEGTATDKVPPARYRNPVFARAFARLVGAAAAVDAVVGRKSSVTKEMLFDHNYEVLQFDENGMPAELVVTDHAGSFVDWERPLAELVPAYAYVVTRRREYVTDYAAFAAAFVEAFSERLTALRTVYLERRTAFDELFKDRPLDPNGSGAYRWAKVLARLEAADPETIRAKLSEACAC